MAKAKKMIKLKVLYEGEIATGAEIPNAKYFNADNVIEVPEDAARSLLKARRVVKAAATAKITKLADVKKYTKEELAEMAEDPLDEIDPLADEGDEE